MATISAFKSELKILKGMILLVSTMRDLIGMAAFCAAVYFVWKTMRMKCDIRDCNGMKVDATIVGHDMKTIGNGMAVYCPIYEYFVENEKHQYTSTIPLIKPLVIGTTVRMIYNSNKKRVVDRALVTAETTKAIMCGGVALFLIWL